MSNEYVYKYSPRTWIVRAMKPASKNTWRITSVSKEHVDCSGGGRTPSAVVEILMGQIVAGNGKASASSIWNSLKSAGYGVLRQIALRTKQGFLGSEVCRWEGGEARLPTLFAGAGRELSMEHAGGKSHGFSRPHSRATGCRWTSKSNPRRMPNTCTLKNIAGNLPSDSLLASLHSRSVLTIKVCGSCRRLCGYAAVFVSCSTTRNETQPRFSPQQQITRPN